MEKLMNKEPDTMKALLANTVYMLCKDGFSFTRRLTIKGLIVVSVDDEAFVVQMDKKFCHSPNGDVVAVNNHANGDNEEEVDDSVERLRVFCEDVANSTQIEEEYEDGFSEDHTQDNTNRMDVSRQSDVKDNQTTSESQGKLSVMNNHDDGSADVAQNFLENFSGSAVVKLEVASDNEDANELLASLNADYNSYLEQENDTSAMSSGSSPLHLLGATQQIGHAPSSASSTSSHCNKINMKQQIKKDVFNYDEEGRRLKSFECQYSGCTKAFFRKDHLTRHQRIKHGKPYGVESQNVYKCCGKTFYKHRSLLKHIKDTHPDRGDTSVLLVVHDNGCYEHVNGDSQMIIETSPSKNTSAESPAFADS